MLSVLIQTLGCKLNQLESEAFTGAFLQAGFRLYDSSCGNSPSIIIVNTCTVTSKADQKARRVIRKALRDYPDSLVLATGCYAQLEKERLEKLEKGSNGRLFVLKGMEKENILFLTEYLKGNENNPLLAVNAMCKINEKDAGEKREGVFQFNPEHFSSHTRSFLKIQDGCDKHCTYCRIRLARGHSVSLEAEQVLERLRILEKSHGEAVLTGVNICQYHDETNGKKLGELLEYLLAGTEKIALRLSSLAPENIDENLAEILSQKRIRPHFHLSIQAGSEKVLEKMGRSYNAQTIEKAASLLRRAKDDPFLACDIIAGFPGETKSEFDETYELCKKIDFAWIHVFPYSKRHGTPAFSFSDTVQEREVTRRVQMLSDLARHGRKSYARRWLDREVEVLIEKGGGSNFCRGISENYLKLLVKYNGEKAPPPGTVLRCRIVQEDPTQRREGADGDFDAVAEEK